MRLVFLGDIHANLAALEAVLGDIRRRPPDAIFHLGNVVGLGPQPGEVIEKLRAEGITGVRGNHDERVVAGVAVPVGTDAWDSVLPAESVCEWTRKRLDASQLHWLERQPFMRTISSGRLRVAFFNASPVSMTLPPHEHQGDDFFREMAAHTRAQVNVFAHTRTPFWKVVDGRWFVNAGSTGFPAGDDARAPYVHIELNGGAAVRIVRVDYEVRKTVDAIRAAGLPAGIIRLLDAA